LVLLQAAACNRVFWHPKQAKREEEVAILIPYRGSVHMENGSLGLKASRVWF